MKVKVTQAPNKPSQAEMDKTAVPVVTGDNTQAPVAELEKGEVYQDQQGGIKKVSEKGALHDDGGVAIDDVHRVLEDTGDKRKDEDSKKLLLTPDEVEERTGYRPSKKVTHSKAFELATEYYDKKVSKMEKGVKKSIKNFETSNDKYAANSLEVNLAMLKTIPTKDELFSSLFDHQEEVKEIHGMNPEPTTTESDLVAAQFGIELPKYQRGGTRQRRSLDGYKGERTDDEYLKLPLNERLDLFYANVRNMGYKGPKDIKQMQAFFTAKHPELTSHYATTVPITNYGASKYGDVDPSNLTPEQRRLQLNDGKFDMRYFRTADKPFGTQAAMDEFTSKMTPIKEGDKTYYTDASTNSPRRTYFDPYVTMPEDNQKQGLQLPPEPFKPVPLDFNYSGEPETPAATTPDAGYPPTDDQYNFNPTRRKGNGFNQPLEWYDVAQPMYSMITSGKEPVRQVTPEVFAPQVRLLDPRPQMYQGQADYNQAMNLLPDSGVGYANVANLYAKKYEINNQVLGQYENANKAKLDQRDAFNAQRMTQQSAIDAAGANEFETKRLTRDEAQRQQRILDIGTLSNTVALNRRFNREGTMVNGMFDYYGYNNQTSGIDRNDNPFTFTSNGMPVYPTGQPAVGGKQKQGYVKNANGTTTLVSIGPNGEVIPLYSGNPDKTAGTIPTLMQGSARRM